MAMSKIALINDFCLDWQMDYVSHSDLKKEFQTLGVSFEEFKEIAEKHSWWVQSMSVLSD